MLFHECVVVVRTKREERKENIVSKSPDTLGAGGEPFALLASLTSLQTANFHALNAWLVLPLRSSPQVQRSFTRVCSDQFGVKKFWYLGTCIVVPQDTPICWFVNIRSAAGCAQIRVCCASFHVGIYSKHEARTELTSLLRRTWNGLSPVGGVCANYSIVPRSCALFGS